MDGRWGLGFILLLRLPAPASAIGPLPYYRYCSLGYAIDTSNLVADYDVNCGFNTTPYEWASRNGTGLARPAVFPTTLAPRTFDATRGLYKLAVTGGRKIA